jgi:hypothetical protein
MENTSSNVQQILDIVIQILIIVIPIVISWYVRTYVRGSVAEKDIAAIVRLSNSAIDYVENLDHRGALNLPPEAKKGSLKLKIAGEWLEQELQRSNIAITDEEAQQWISSQFQKRVGDVKMVGNLSQLAKTAVELIKNLEQNDLINLPSEVDNIAYSASLAADWLIAQAAATGVNVTREEAIIWVRAEILRALQIETNSLPTNEQLGKLAQQAISFMKELKADGRLSIQTSATGQNMEMDIALAWLLAESAKRGLAVSTDQITQALNQAIA